MKCVIRKKGETKPGNTTITLERDGTILVFKSVPARVCGICGERMWMRKSPNRFLSLPKTLRVLEFKSRSANIPPHR